MKQIILLFILTLVFITPIAFWWQRGTLQSTSTSRTFNTSSTTHVKKQVSIHVEEVATNLVVPWSIVFTSLDRILVAERPGSIRSVQNHIVSQPLITLPDVVSSPGSESGLMGMALDPSYAKNKLLYICYTYRNAGVLENKIMSLHDLSDSIKLEKLILDHIPAAANHAGCRIKFGPDDKLYITTGDSLNKSLAQDPTSLAGKILRINADGSLPNDNPITGSPVWSFGHRNPQGIDWQPTTQELIATEHGPSGFDGPGGGDEINNIQKGANYGWPLVSHIETDPRFVTPLLVFTPAVAPSAGMFYKSNVIPQYTNNYFFGALKGEGIYRVVFTDNNAQKVDSYEKLKEVNVGRIREVVQGPEGALYFTTSNRDGRGRPQADDDKIYKLTP